MCAKVLRWEGACIFKKLKEAVVAGAPKEEWRSTLQIIWGLIVKGKDFVIVRE